MYEYLLLIIFFLCFFLFVYWVCNYENSKWKKIESLNISVGINRDNSYLDERGYLRCNTDKRLWHRKIAWRSYSGVWLFSKLDVHHRDFNKLNNNPSNLVALTRSAHRRKHTKHYTYSPLLLRFL